jgi:hypothetical protein
MKPAAVILSAQRRPQPSGSTGWAAEPNRHGRDREHALQHARSGETRAQRRTEMRKAVVHHDESCKSTAKSKRKLPALLGRVQD